MIYKLFNPMVGWAMRRYFRNIHVSGLEHIPKDTAVIFACNHPSSFMEPMLLASVQPRKLFYLVRGDIFKGKLIKWFLKETHQIPIFRRRDGITNLKQNEKTFRICYKMLLDHGALIIFPEGSTKRVKQLRPLQRGIWRLAFGTLARDRNLDIVIVPVGVNFTDLDHIRSEAMISFGAPIPLNQYYDAYEADKPGTMRKLTPMLYEKMRPHVVHYDVEKLEVSGEPLLALTRNQTPDKFKQFIHSRKQLNAEIRAASSYSSMNSGERELLSAEVQSYLEKLPDGVQTDYIVAQKGKPASWSKLGLLAIPGIIGILLGYLPYKFAWWGQQKLVNNDPPFHAPIRLAIFLLTVLLLVGISFLVLLPFLGVLALSVFLAPLLIVLGARLFDQILWTKASWRLMHSQLDIDALMKERERILSKIL